MERREFLKSVGAAFGSIGLPWFTSKASGKPSDVTPAKDAKTPKRYICYPEEHVFPDRKILEPLIKYSRLFRSILIDKAIIRNGLIYYPASVSIGGEMIRTWELMGDLPEKFKQEWLNLRAPSAKGDPNAWAMFTNYELYCMVSAPNKSYDHNHNKQP